MNKKLFFMKKNTSPIIMFFKILFTFTKNAFNDKNTFKTNKISFLNFSDFHLLFQIILNTLF